MIGSSAIKWTGHPIGPLGKGQPGLFIQLDDAFSAAPSHTWFCKAYMH